MQPKGTMAIREDTVRAKTGKGWEEWFAILDEWGAAEHGHTAAARYLRTELGVSPWWAQAITVRHEYARGLREPRSSA